MAQVKLLKVGAEGLPSENEAADDVTFNSFTAALAGGFSVTSGVSITEDITFNAVDDLIAGIENQNLVDKTAAETITGAWALDTGGHFDATNGEFTFPDTADGTPVVGGSYWDGDTLFVYDGSQYLAVGGEGAFVSNLDVLYTADEALTAAEAVYISAADNVSKAIADNSGADKVIGFAVTTVSDTDPVFVRKHGVIPGALVGATAGDRYYLSATVAGDVTSTIPTGAGNRVIQVGFAKNATDLDINIQFLAIRT